jgi:hypothetical protein
VDQGHPLVAAQESRQADHRPARQARRGPAGQQAALPRLPAQGGAAAALPPRRRGARVCAPRRLADLGVEIQTGAVHQARPHHPPPPRRHPRRDPTRPQQRPARRPQQPHPPDQPPQLRLPLRRTTDRARLPLLHPHRHPTPEMTFTPKRTGAPFEPGSAARPLRGDLQTSDCFGHRENLGRPRIEEGPRDRRRRRCRRAGCQRPNYAEHQNGTKHAQGTAGSSPTHKPTPR